MHTQPRGAVVNDAVLCKHCGMRFDHHGADNNQYGYRACPASKVFPKYPTKIKDHVRAEELFAKRIARHWTKRGTCFEATT